MDKYKKDLNIIKHILDYCNEIEQTIARFGATFDSFKADKIYRNAATMCILQIGELTGRLSFNTGSTVNSNLYVRSRRHGTKLHAAFLFSTNKSVKHLPMSLRWLFVVAIQYSSG